MSLPLLSSEHPTTQPSHHFILLTYITVITALADLLCADLEILSLVLPPTHLWFFSDNRTLVSFPDLPPSFSLSLTPSMQVRKLFPNLLSPSSKDYNSSAVGLVRYYACRQNILWIRLAEGKSLNLQKFALKSGWLRFSKSFCASTFSKNTSVHLQCRSFTQHETLSEAASHAYMDSTAHFPEEHTTVLRLCVTNCLKIKRQILPTISTLFKA